MHPGRCRSWFRILDHPHPTFLHFLFHLCNLASGTLCFCGTISLSSLPPPPPRLSTISSTYQLHTVSLARLMRASSNSNVSILFLEGTTHPSGDKALFSISYVAAGLRHGMGFCERGTLALVLTAGERKDKNHPSREIHLCYNWIQAKTNGRIWARLRITS